MGHIPYIRVIKKRKDMTYFEFTKRLPNKERRIDFIMSMKYMQDYVNEFRYRLNHRDNNEAFASLVKLAIL